MKPNNCSGRSASAWPTWPLLIAVWLAALPLIAEGTELRQPMRDPTLPPAMLRQPSASSAASAAGGRPAASSPAPTPPPTLLIVDGRRYVIIEGRRRAVGDLFGTSRIERIEETGVWVRSGGRLREIAMYDGVVKRAPAFQDPTRSHGTPGKGPQDMKASTRGGPQ